MHPKKQIDEIPQALTDLKNLELPMLTQSSNKPESSFNEIPIIGDLPFLPFVDTSNLLPSHFPPWKILVVDDDARFLADLVLAAQEHKNAVDVHTLQAKLGTNAFELKNHLISQEWRADLLVLDVNLSKGGISSSELLKGLRAMPGHRALPVVAATSNHFGQSEEDESHETEKSRAQFVASSEGLLWGKIGSAKFLQRICENMDFWRQTARRRAWSELLESVAKQIDEAIDKDPSKVSTRINEIASQVVDFIHQELGPVSVYLRWREENNSYRLVHGKGHDDGKTIPWLNPEDVPILTSILPNSTRTEDEVWVLENDGISPDEAGVLPYLKGRRFLGARITLGKRTYGFLTLTRKADDPPFDADVDPQQLGLLVRVLASSLGRIETLSDIRQRQHHLLSILTGDNKNDNMTGNFSRGPICQQIVELLHKSLHANPSASNGLELADDANGKVTCRLVEFAKGDLVPMGATGFGGSVVVRAGKPISIKDHETSIIAYVIHRSNDPAYANEKKFRWNDVKDQAETKGRFKDNDNMKTRSELCVPIRVGQHTIGALNLEHTSKAFYTQLDEEFVLLVAQSLGQLLSNLTAQRFQNGLLDLAHQFLEAKPQTLYQAFKKVLHQLCGHSIYAELEPDPRDPILPWKATNVEVLLELEGTPSAEAFQEELNSEFANHWTTPTTLLPRLLREKQWQNSYAYFTADPVEFTAITIATDVQQRADAVLWVCKDDFSVPHKAILLLWGLPPPIGSVQVKHMDRLMRVFAGIETFNDKVHSLVEQRALGEQYEALGHVLQHFRHRLKQNTTNLGNYVDYALWALTQGKLQDASSVLNEIKNEVEVIKQGYHESRGYVKDIRIQKEMLHGLVESVRQDPALKLRMESVNWENRVPLHLSCFTDPVIAKLILYSVVENALDALSNVNSKSIIVTAMQLGTTVALRITDNGLGISPENRVKLFKEVGFTTKGGGLGSALPFARIRARQMNADITLDESVTYGACFVLTFPVDHEILKAS